MLARSSKHVVLTVYAVSWGLQECFFKTAPQCRPCQWETSGCHLGIEWDAVVKSCTFVYFRPSVTLRPFQLEAG